MTIATKADGWSAGKTATIGGATGITTIAVIAIMTAIGITIGGKFA